MSSVSGDAVQRKIECGRRLVLAARIEGDGTAVAVYDGRTAAAALGARRRLHVERVEVVIPFLAVEPVPLQRHLIQQQQSSMKRSSWQLGRVRAALQHKREALMVDKGRGATVHRGPAAPESR